MIGFSVLHPALLLLLLLLPAGWVAWQRWPPPLRGRRSQLALGLRLLVIACLVLALAGVRVSTLPQRQALVAVVDLSASLRQSQDQEAAAVRRLAAAKGPDDLFGVVSFGRGAEVELPASLHPDFDVFQTQPDPGYTDIASALQLAANLVPDGYARHLVLLTDGRQNLGDAAAVVAALRAEGVRVDVLGIGGQTGPEVLILRVEAPTELRAGQAAVVTVRVRSSGPADGHLVLLGAGGQIEERELKLAAGVSSYSFQLPALEAGVYRIRAELSAQPDTYPENNLGEAVIRVLGRPTVLVLEGMRDEGANVASALTASGMSVERRLSSELPGDPAALSRYDSIVLVNTPADSFPHDGMAAIATVVRDLGRGLVAIGGGTSYGPGGWQGTPLEEALPVRMELPNRPEKPKVAVVLIMESMEGQRADMVALGAAEALIDKLGPEDQIAVTNGDPRCATGGSMLIPMTPVTDKAALDRKLEGASLGDPPSYLCYLKLAADALQKADAAVKHIVLLGDGDADADWNAGGSEYHTVLANLRSQGITTSVIGINTHGSQPAMVFMADIARLGGGRFYESNDPSQVPQLFLKESQVALRPWFEVERFFPKVTSAGNLLEGVPLDAFPELGGYVVTSTKPNAEVYFQSPKADPVLAAWQYGLGRSLAWTSDSNGRWTAGFLRSSVSQILFARMVGWTLPSAQGGRLKLEAVPSGDGLEVTASGQETSGATLSVTVVRPDLSTETVALPAHGSGQWQGRVPAAQVGTYVLHGQLKRQGSVLAESELAVAVPYSPEYLDTGLDEPLLRELAKEGGTLLARPELAWKQPALPVPVSTDVFWLLLLLAVVLWPLDVVIRRLMVSPGQALSFARSLVQLRRPVEITVEVPPELARLRRRVSLARQRPEGAPPVVTPAASASEPAAAKSAEADQQTEEALSARLLEARRRRRGGG